MRFLQLPTTELLEHQEAGRIDPIIKGKTYTAQEGVRMTELHVDDHSYVQEMADKRYEDGDEKYKYGGRSILFYFRMLAYVLNISYIWRNCDIISC